MNRKDLLNQIKLKNSYLCIGLDPDYGLIPKSLPKNPHGVLEFNKRIIEATHDLCIAYKPNTAFYESMGEKGWEILEETFRFIPSDHFIIADAKRGDIGNTSRKYAEAFFNPSLDYRVDAVTINPYMGMDSVQPFLDYKDKWGVILALTSNPGSANFQLQKLANGHFLYEEVLLQAKTWADPDQIMFVVGATQSDWIASIRKWVPDHFLLIPGIGAQGGDLEKISEAGFNGQGGLLVNASRSILYASTDSDYAEKARASALETQKMMEKLLVKFSIV
jgi:orotidine-5'-phosphate decarboxylase